MGEPARKERFTQPDEPFSTDVPESVPEESHIRAVETPTKKVDIGEMLNDTLAAEGMDQQSLKESKEMVDQAKIYSLAEDTVKSAMEEFVKHDLRFVAADLLDRYKGDLNAENIKVPDAEVKVILKSELAKHADVYRALGDDAMVKRIEHMMSRF